MIRVKFESENNCEYNQENHVLTFKKNASLRNIHTGIVDYGDLPQMLMFDGVEIEIKEVYEDAMIMVEKDNHNVTYVYLVDKNECYKIG